MTDTPTVDVVEYEYVPDAIQRMAFPDPVRMRPGMYIGDAGVRGLHTLLWEIVNNAVDEAVAGYVTQIDVTLGADGSLSVRDNGRGIPAQVVGESGKSCVEHIFTAIGGNNEHKNYKVGGGLHNVSSG